MRKATLVIAVIALLALGLSGPGTRFGLWPWQAGLALFALAGLLGVVAAVAAAIQRRIAVVALGIAAAAAPLAGLVQALLVPRINDVSSDLVLPGSPQAAFPRALAAAQGMGWEVVKSEAPAGRIEAVATTLWFGFKDDIEVHITAQGADSRVGVRSKSRVGRGDAGANAARIRAYFERLK